MKTEWMSTPANWQQLVPHPLSELTEFGRGIDVDAMAEFMREHGYDNAEAIVLYEDDRVLKMLDGRHKQQACIKAGLTPTFKRFVGKDPLAYVVKKAFRQHLSASARAMLAAKLSQKSEKSAGMRFSAATQEEASEALNVSPRATDNAAKVLKSGTPKLQAAVAEGDISVTDAAKIASEPPKVQDAAVEEVKKGRSKTAAEAVKKLEPVKDSAGHEVTEACLAAFAGLEQWKEIDSLCRKLQSAIDEVSRQPGGEQLAAILKATGAEGKTINRSEHLNALKRDLKGTRPYSVCPYCEGKGKASCKGCSGCAWVTKTTYDTAGDDLKERLS